LLSISALDILEHHSRLASFFCVFSFLALVLVFCSSRILLSLSPIPVLEISKRAEGLKDLLVAAVVVLFHACTFLLLLFTSASQLDKKSVKYGSRLYLPLPPTIFPQAVDLAFDSPTPMFFFLFFFICPIKATTIYVKWEWERTAVSGNKWSGLMVWV
jgi:hypothetical protein